MYVRIVCVYVCIWFTCPLSICQLICMCVYDSHVCYLFVSYYVCVYMIHMSVVHLSVIMYVCIWFTCPLCSRQVSTLQDSKQSYSPKFSSFHGSQRASTYFWSAPNGPHPSSELTINSRRNSLKIPAEMVNRMFGFCNWSCPTLSLIASMVTGLLRLRPVPQYCMCRVVCCPPFLHNIFICVVDVRGHFAGCHGDQAQVPLHWLWMLPLHLWLGWVQGPIPHLARMHQKLHAAEPLYSGHHRDPAGCPV